MSSHRKAIRAAVVALLKATPTMANQKVFPARILPIQSLEELPCLLVYTSDEKSNPTGDAQYLERTCTLSIEGAVSADEYDLDDLLDDLAQQVEDVIDANPTLSGLLSKNLILKSTMIESGKEGEVVVGGFRLDFDADYSTVLVEQDGAHTAPTSIYSHPDINDEFLIEIGGVAKSPLPPPETACGPDGCAMPVWKGEIE